MVASLQTIAAFGCSFGTWRELFFHQVTWCRYLAALLKPQHFRVSRAPWHPKTTNNRPWPNPKTRWEKSARVTSIPWFTATRKCCKNQERTIPIRKMDHPTKSGDLKNPNGQNKKDFSKSSPYFLILALHFLPTPDPTFLFWPFSSF